MIEIKRNYRSTRFDSKGYQTGPDRFTAVRDQDEIWIMDVQAGRLGVWIVKSRYILTDSNEVLRDSIIEIHELPAIIRDSVMDMKLHNIDLSIIK